ncbi:MAG: Lrp/AsnC family transcriptional regulator [Rhizobiales bacterium]|nr:Lrp/AsnC family transcriptional regulator [Hyphomicrobiales bacterium]
MTMFDDLDQRLIAELRADARLPALTLSRRLGVSRGTIQNRIARLRRDKVILGFTVRLGDAVEGNAIRAVTMIEIRSGDTRSVIAALKRLPEVAALHSTHGRWDLVASLVASDLSALDQALAAIRQVPGVSASETTILMTPV